MLPLVLSELSSECPWQEKCEYMTFQQNNSEIKKKESIWGVISCGLALITLACSIIFLLSATYFEISNPGAIDETSSIAIITGLMLLLILAASFLGTILGFIGIFQASKKKTFPVIGAFLNSIILVGLVVLVLFGLLSE